MFIKFQDIFRLGYFWILRLRSSADYKNYQLVKTKILINYLKRYIKKNGRMLEVGVQSGEMTPFFKEISEFIISIDIDKMHLKSAKENSPDTEVICGDLLHPPFKDNSFDIVILNSVIEHIEDEEYALKEIYKLQKNNGYLYIGFPPWYGIFGGHSSIPFFSILPLTMRTRLSRYKFVRAYPTYPRSVKYLEKKINNYFIIISKDSLLLPNLFIHSPFYEVDFFITFICKKKFIRDISTSKLSDKGQDYSRSNAKELSKYWDKIDY